MQPVVDPSQTLELLGEIGDHLRPFRAREAMHGLQPPLCVGQQAVDDTRRTGLVGIDQLELVGRGSVLGRRPDRSLEGFSVLVRVQYEGAPTHRL